MKLKFLGTGASQGIPVLGSNHLVSLSDNPKDKRLRTSALITTNKEKKILIDCGPDFRQQMLSNSEKNIDAAIITHEHNDHIIGMDDLRPIIHRKKINFPLYCCQRTATEIQKRFSYAFQEVKYPGTPNLEVNIIEKTFSIFGITIEPIRIFHGTLPILGYKIRNLAYITDASFISEEEQTKLKNLNILIINCLRKNPVHKTHFILPQVLELIQKVKPKKTYLTHISEDFGFHSEIEKELPKNIHLAYDKLEINF